MLNRRLLRIKAMQSIYAFVKCRASAYKLSLTFIEEQFHEESMVEGRDKLNELKKEEGQAKEYFEQNYTNENYVRPAHLNERYIKIADRAIHKYQNSIGKDYRTTKAKMLTDTQNLHRLYLKSLNILCDIAKLAEHRYTANKDLNPKDKSLYWQLTKDNTVQLLLRNESLKRATQEYNISNDSDLIGSWHHRLERNSTFFEAIHQENEDIPKELRVMRYFFREFLLKDEKVVSTFEEQDLNWNENKTILKTMLTKTAKRIYEEQSEQTTLMALSRNWEEDKLFFESLFVNYWKYESEVEALITKKSNRWPVKRMAEVDKLLIGMGISEMLHFSGIPTKVTINEYIEIAKQYSTPKSALFLNGLLDSIASDLTNAGKIKKSGRGLINR